MYAEVLARGCFISFVFYLDLIPKVIISVGETVTGKHSDLRLLVSWISDWVVQYRVMRERREVSLQLLRRAWWQGWKRWRRSQLPFMLDLLNTKLCHECSMCITWLNFSDSPWRFGHYYPHLTDKETEVEKNEVTGPRHNGANGKVQGQVSLAPQSVLSIIALLFSYLCGQNTL